MKKGKDDFGDRIKNYESQTTSDKLIPRLPVIARLDGHSFSKFTKGLKRPYDKRISDLMIETTKYLSSKYNTNISYTQSDEITLIWYLDDYKSNMIFNGKLFKLTSLMAPSASVFFNKNLESYIPEKSHLMPEFDCRVWNVPNLDESVNCLLWRENDAIKNSISMLTQSMFSHNELHNKNGSDKINMMMDSGVDWNQYPNFFKKGTYIQRKRKLVKFTKTELEKLPSKHKAKTNPNLKVERNVIEVLDLSISEIENKIDVMIYGKDPKLKNK